MKRIFWIMLAFIAGIWVVHNYGIGDRTEKMDLNDEVVVSEPEEVIEQATNDEEPVVDSVVESDEEYDSPNAANPTQIAKTEDFGSEPIGDMPPPPTVIGMDPAEDTVTMAMMPIPVMVEEIPSLTRDERRQLLERRMEILQLLDQ